VAFLTFATSSPLSVSSTTELTVQPSGVASVVNLPLCHNEPVAAARRPGVDERESKLPEQVHWLLDGPDDESTPRSRRNRPPHRAKPSLGSLPLDQQIGQRRRGRLPAGVRERCGLASGRRVLLTADLATRLLVGKAAERGGKFAGNVTS